MGLHPPNGSLIQQQFAFDEHAVGIDFKHLELKTSTRGIFVYSDKDMHAPFVLFEFVERISTYETKHQFWVCRGCDLPVSDTAKQYGNAFGKRALRLAQLRKIAVPISEALAVKIVNLLRL